MPYTLPSKTKVRNRSRVNITQREFSLGYISTYANSRRPINSVSDATNMELVQDNIWRPRPPTVRYGTQPAYTVIGRGSYRYNGVRGMLFMFNVGGTGKIYRQTDGGAFTVIGGVNAYDSATWAGFVQSKNRIYVYNGTDNLSYIDLTTMATVEYVSLGPPTSVGGTGSANLTSGTKPFNYYYKVTANNTVGESAASTVSAAVNVNDIRDNWSATGAKTVTVAWTAPAGAITSYTIYGGDDTNHLFEIVTLAGLTTLSFVDDGSYTLNPFKEAPSSNSTQGAVFSWMYVDTRNAQVYGVTASNQLYYSAPGTGDFSSLNGGGFTTIDEGGDTLLNFVNGFRTGKGDPVITTSSRGAAGKGKLHHTTFDSVTYGTQIIYFPNVIEASGQSGTYAPRATVKARDSIYYPTGDAFKSTGTSQNIINILTTLSISQVIIDDVNKLDLTNLDKAAGVEYQDKIYYCLPVESTENNEIWILDLSRKNAWTLRWPTAAKDIWLYEDSLGTSHLCVLVDNVILEFTRAGSTTTSDDGVAFSTRLAFSSLVWDDAGIALANIRHQYFKLLNPIGNITVNSFGLSKRGVTSNVGTDNYDAQITYTGYDTWLYDSDDRYDQDPGSINLLARSVAVLTVKPKGLLVQLDWEILTSIANCDYYLSSVSTRGMANTDLVFQGVG